MDISRISTGPNPPRDVHVIVEVPLGGVPVKYEMDKASGALFVDRFLHTSLLYLANYGFIHTPSEDRDPIGLPGDLAHASGIRSCRSRSAYRRF